MPFFPPIKLPFIDSRQADEASESSPLPIIINAGNLHTRRAPFTRHHTSPLPPTDCVMTNTAGECTPVCLHSFPQPSARVL